jgi:formiminotetrahydrofolate cyclodeaminase
VPLEITRLSAQAIELQKKFAEKGSVLAISDAATGVMLCRGALYGGAVNVRVNTHSMKDRAYAESINREADELTEKYGKMADEIYMSILERLK